MSEYEYHQARVTDVTFTESKSGNPQIEFEIDVLNAGNSIGMSRRIWLAMSDKAWEYTEAKLKRIGFVGTPEEFDWDREAIVDVSMRMEEKFSGEGQVEKWDIAPPKKVAKPLDAAEASKWSEKFRVSFGEADAKPEPKKKAPARKKAPPRKEPASTGECPFEDADGAWEWFKETIANDPDSYWELVDKHGGEDNFDAAAFYSEALPF